MTKDEYYAKFNLQELELICTKSEFLNVLAADDFDPVLADEVAHRILKNDSPAFLNNSANPSATPAEQTAWECPRRGEVWPPGSPETSRLLWNN
jgi:hypothetical protein